MSVWDALTCGINTPHRKRYRGVYRLDALPAPRPSTIVWENISSGPCASVLASVISALATALFLCLSLLSVFAARVALLLTPDSLEPLAQAVLPFLVFLLSVALAPWVKALAHNLEKHHTRDSRDWSIFTRLSLAHLLQSAGILLVLNVDFSSLFPSTPTLYASLFQQLSQSGVPADILPALGLPGAFQSASPGWYLRVGVPLLLMQLGNCLSPHFGTCIRSCRWKAVRWGLRGGPCPPHVASLLRLCCGFRSQRALNTSMVGGEFPMAERYALALSSFTICFTFSLGQPLLAFVGAGGVGLMYALDLASLSYFYSKPPVQSPLLPQFIAKVCLPALLAVNAGVSAWTLVGPAFPLGFVETSFLPSTAPQLLGPIGGAFHQCLRASTLGCVLIIFLSLQLLFQETLIKLGTEVFCLRKETFCLCISRQRSRGGGGGRRGGAGPARRAPMLAG